MSRELREGLVEMMEEVSEDIREEFKQELEILHKRIQEVEQTNSAAIYSLQRFTGGLRDRLNALEGIIESVQKIAKSAYNDWQHHITRIIAVAALVMACVIAFDCGGCAPVTPDVTPAAEQSATPIG